MEVRARAVARIPTESYELALSHGAFQGREAGIALGLFMPILIAPHGRMDTGRERLQVAVDAGVAFGMSDIDGIAETIFSHGDATDVAIADGVDGFPFHVVGPDVEPTMEMVRARLTKITRQRDFVAYWRVIDAQKDAQQECQHALNDISSPLTECVSAPTEMKSTPCRA